MDASAGLAAAFTGMKATLGLVRGAAAAAVDHQVKAKLIEVQQAILDVQALLGDAQTERLQLLEEKATLRQRVRELERTRAALDAYELVDVGGGTMLYRSKGDAGHLIAHYVCPACFSKGSVAAIQSAATGSQRTHYACSTCTFSRSAGDGDPVRPIGSRSSWRAL